MPLPVDQSSPRVEVGTRHAHQTTRHGDPEIAGVIFDRPMTFVAGKSVARGQRRNVSVLQTIDAALGGRPERPVAADAKVVDAALSESFGGGVRRAGLGRLTVFHELDAAVI